MTIFHMKPAVTWLMNMPLEVYSRREREEEEEEGKLIENNRF